MTPAAHGSRLTATATPVLPEPARSLAAGRGPGRATARVLVAGVGDILFGDEGFGVEVAQRLLHRRLPAGVEVVDFGVRGFDLARALGGAESVILVDVYPHGRPPGDLTVVEPSLTATTEPMGEPVDGDGLDPASVLRLARALNSLPARLLLVGCQPDTADLDDQVGLSAPVEAAVLEAVLLVESLAADLVRH